VVAQPRREAAKPPQTATILAIFRQPSGAMQAAGMLAFVSRPRAAIMHRKQCLLQ
jgi:hypothetical protein